MVVILFLICLIVYRLANVKHKDEKGILLKSIFLNFLLSLICLCILQKEIAYNGGLEGTIGTDAYRNWLVLKHGLDHNMSFIDFFKSASYYKFFFWFEYLVLYTSPIKTPVILYLANILLEQNIIILIYLFIKNSLKDIEYKSLKIILYITAVNGGFIFTSIVLFKDILLTYLILELFVIVSTIKYRITIRQFIFLLFLSLCINSIRPFSIGICLICILYQLYLNRKIYNLDNNKYNPIKIKRDFFKFILIIIIFALICTKLPYIKGFLDKTNQIAISDVSQELSDGYMAYHKEILNTNYANRLIIGTFRITLLPSVFRTMFSPLRFAVYEYEGIIGRILEINWQILYIFTLVIGMYHFIFSKDKALIRLLPYFLFCIIQFFTYALLYMGSPQVRWKLLFIIFLNICFGLGVRKVNQYKKFIIINIALVFYIIIMFIWGCIYLFNYRA